MAMRRPGDYGHARVHGVEIVTTYLNRFILDDRLPTDDDVALTTETVRQGESMNGLEFMQRLAAPVPRPRLHLIRFHGVLAPNAKLRAQVVSSRAQLMRDAQRCGSCGSSACACARAAPSSSCPAGTKRVFEIDMEHCPNCGGELKIIAAILETTVIERIIEHLGLPARAPPRSPARAPASHAA
jgi:hypothetical protein